ncbi:DNA starvation/stationary phase protection protein [Salinivibrio proteolyticus]|uniref:Dps family protein n=1 Tax=Salinivibrio proteolyticus TaxID=334715 RepID=UPI0009897229|nr:Dps family protein [Salinivibrio proteolyticus]OOF25431.1 DNA starvation/stationary phase protection protein [Salinivibrio proteolyticus]
MSKQAALIGLDSSKAAELGARLDTLLANYQVLYTNVRGFHWNIKGNDFFELHTKFEEIYTDLQTKIDEVAERILTIGGTAEHRFSEYLKVSEIKEHDPEANGQAGVRALVEGFSVLIALQRDIMDLAGDAGDEGTSALMSDYIREQEKLMWMLNAYLN